MSFRWIFLEDQIIYDIVRLPTVCVAEASVSFFLIYDINSQHHHQPSVKGPSRAVKKLAHPSFNIFRSGCLRTYLQADGGVVK